MGAVLMHIIFRAPTPDLFYHRENREKALREQSKVQVSYLPQIVQIAVGRFRHIGLPTPDFGLQTNDSGLMTNPSSFLYDNQDLANKKRFNIVILIPLTRE